MKSIESRVLKEKREQNVLKKLKEFNKNSPFILFSEFLTFCLFELEERANLYSPSLKHKRFITNTYRNSRDTVANVYNQILSNGLFHCLTQKYQNPEDEKVKQIIEQKLFARKED